MRLRSRFGCVLIALGLGIGTALQFAAQNHPRGKPPPKQQGQAPSQGHRQQLQRTPKAQKGRPRKPNDENRSPQVRSDHDQRPDFNSNPTARSPLGNPKRFEDLSPAEKRRMLENQEKFSRLPPQRQREIREAAQWIRAGELVADLTGVAGSHIRERTRSPPVLPRSSPNCSLAANSGWR